MKTQQNPLPNPILEQRIKAAEHESRMVAINRQVGLPDGAHHTSPDTWAEDVLQRKAAARLAEVRARFAHLHAEQP